MEHVQEGRPSAGLQSNAEQRRGICLERSSMCPVHDLQPSPTGPMAMCWLAVRGSVGEAKDAHADVAVARAAVLGRLRGVGEQVAARVPRDIGGHGTARDLEDGLARRDVGLTQGKARRMARSTSRVSRSYASRAGRVELDRTHNVDDRVLRAHGDVRAVVCEADRPHRPPAGIAQAMNHRTIIERVSQGPPMACSRQRRTRGAERSGQARARPGPRG